MPANGSHIELTDDEREQTEASGAHVGCECPQCREARLSDTERLRYTAHEMVDAYTRGWADGYKRGVTQAEKSRDA